MLQSVQPEVVGHFDLIRIFADKDLGDATLLESEVWELIVRNLEYVIKYGGLFEINSRSWKKGLRDAYPQRDIIKVKKGFFLSFKMLYLCLLSSKDNKRKRRQIYIIRRLPWTQ